MNKTELDSRTKIITPLMAIWNCSGNDNLIAAYVATTKDIPVFLLDRACKKLAIESETRPVPATILKAARSIQSEMAGADILPWDQAWQEIEKEMHDTFVYGEPRFSKPEIKRAVDAFGWQELCEVTIKELPIVRAQLRDMYNSICEQARNRRTNQYVLGIGVLVEEGTNGKIDTGKYPKIQRSTH